MSDSRRERPFPANELRMLAERVHEGSLSPGAVDYLLSAAGRLEELLAYRPGGGPVPEAGEPSSGAVESLADLQDRLGAIGDRAAGAGADPAVTEYLRTVLLRATLLHQQEPPDMRLVPRFPETRPARVHPAGGSTLDALLVDRSALGFGLRAGEPVAEGQLATLELPPVADAEAEVHECLVIFCRETEPGVLRVGLDVVDGDCAG
ncbi:hypothetical protein [Thiohalorhabdus methylotrophus]|uniref:PilZ domain-containing protein n=1 Tax=Thiohalorhabdus methylotrophus TaxID=3242694 RepID=A0ABV4TSS9_9GAMM